MKRFVHYHNMATGEAFWSSEVDIDESKPIESELNELLQNSKARLTHWAESEQAGVFHIGPLPGIITLTETAPPRDLTGYECTRLWEVCRAHPVAVGEPVE